MASSSGQVRLGQVLLGWCEPADHDISRISRLDADRLAGLAPARRAPFLAGRSLLRFLIGQLMPGAQIELAGARCPDCGGHHGAPVVRGAPVVAGLAHSAGIVVAAVAPDNAVTRVGVDVEADRPAPADLVTLIGGPAETALRRWTRIEAVVKADGRGLRIDPSSVRLGDGVARIEEAALREGVALRDAQPTMPAELLRERGVGEPTMPAELLRERGVGELTRSAEFLGERGVAEGARGRSVSQRGVAEATYRVADVVGPSGWLISLAWQEAGVDRVGPARR